MSRPLIFIADLLHALDELRIESPGHAREVMRMLSLESWTEIAGARPEPAGPTDAPPAPPPAIEPRPPGPAAATDAASATVADSAAAAPSRAAVTPLEPAPATMPRPGWAGSAPAMPRAGPTTSPPADPLFDPQQERATVASLAAGLVDDDSVDIDRLIAALARGEPLHKLPAQRAWGLRRGVQVLVDQGAGMAPFSGDVEQFMARLSRLLPPDRLQRAGFEGSPLRALRIPKKKRAPWQPPADGVVLVISELGLCGGDECLHAAGVAEWLEFADAARRAGVQLRTLVPYPPSRWPAALCGPLRCVHWDRRTSAATARRALAGIAG